MTTALSVDTTCGWTVRHHAPSYKLVPDSRVVAMRLSTLILSREQIGGLLQVGVVSLPQGLDHDGGGGGLWGSLSHLAVEREVWGARAAGGTRASKSHFLFVLVRLANREIYT